MAGILFFLQQNFGSPTWARTRDTRINSPLLYRLSYWRSISTAAFYASTLKGSSDFDKILINLVFFVGFVGRNDFIGV